MKKLLIVVIVLMVAGAAYAGLITQWGYSGAEGPEHWGKLDPKFSACSAGKNQSPINLTDFIESDLKPVSIQYEAGGNEIINNRHTIMVRFAPGSKISIDGHEFELRQYHFHAPSENHINGKSYPMEAHLVHVDQNKNLAVIAVMFEEGQANQSLADVWSHMPEKGGERRSLPSAISAEGILPSNRDYYRFNGSLTTPPCSEGVWWLVMTEAVTASKEQIDKFAQVMGHPNNRPLQPLNARPVLK
ncbi:MAG: carbonic anhydrase family protein [Desulfobacterales bacterium]|jgi:carbonic anhydrase